VDTRHIVESDQVAIFIGADAMILNIPKELHQHVDMLAQSGKPLNMVEEQVLGLKELTEGEVMVCTSIAQ
jgi:FMN-dependent NADH-azoreductase